MQVCDALEDIMEGQKPSLRLPAVDGCGHSVYSVCCIYVASQCVTTNNKINKIKCSHLQQKWVFRECCCNNILHTICELKGKRGHISSGVARIVLSEFVGKDISILFGGEKTTPGSSNTQCGHWSSSKVMICEIWLCDSPAGVESDRQCSVQITGVVQWFSSHQVQ